MTGQKSLTGVMFKSCGYLNLLCGDLQRRTLGALLWPIWFWQAMNLSPSPTSSHTGRGTQALLQRLDKNKYVYRGVSPIFVLTNAHQLT